MRTARLFQEQLLSLQLRRLKNLSNFLPKHLEGSRHFSTIPRQCAKIPSSKTNNGHPSKSPSPSRKGFFNTRGILGGFAFCVLVPTGIWYILQEEKNTKPFDPPRFTPFTIVNREIVCSTSLILTLRPQIPPSNESTEELYKENWEKGIWSVEVKQPELQIARSYTPLPPTKLDKNGELRFLIRKELKGEVSGYLHSLPVGAKIELRGPHPGYDIPQDIQKVVFLAGGTSIAPALQVAYTLLDRRNAKNKAIIHIVWANRKREDCREQKGLIVQELDALQQKHPGQLTVEYLVDEENTFLDKKKISRITSESQKGGGPGSKLLFISGPEGFINYFAGPKKWEGGKEGQGQLAGVLGQMGLKDWTVWKL